MNIRDLYTASTNRAEQLRSGSMGGAMRPESAGSEQTKAIQPVAPVRDRVEISDAARAAAAEHEKSQQLEFAKKALHSLPPLSAERAADIQKRIEEGYYSQPDVVKKIAEKAVPDLTGKLE